MKKRSIREQNEWFLVRTIFCIVFVDARKWNNYRPRCGIINNRRREKEQLNKFCKVGLLLLINCLITYSELCCVCTRKWSRSFRWNRFLSKCSCCFSISRVDGSLHENYLFSQPTRNYSKLPKWMKWEWQRIAPKQSNRHIEEWLFFQSSLQFCVRKWKELWMIWLSKQLELAFSFFLLNLTAESIEWKVRLVFAWNVRLISKYCVQRRQHKDVNHKVAMREQ